MKRFIAIVLMLLFVLPCCVACNDAEETGLTSNNSSNTSEQSQNQGFSIEVTIDTEKTYYAEIDIKDYGKIKLQLDGKVAPVTVSNFVTLAESGFYNGLTFHRIMEGFMMQGGDPAGNGTGGSERKIKGEFAENGHNNTISHKRGVVSMARQGNAYNDAPFYNTASCQFFICHEDSLFLDGKYASFGWVIEGMDVVDAVCTSATPIDSNGTIIKEQQPVINSITITVE